jgi:hypothetical protein
VEKCLWDVTNGVDWGVQKSISVTAATAAQVAAATTAARTEDATSEAELAALEGFEFAGAFHSGASANGVYVAPNNPTRTKALPSTPMHPSFFCRGGREERCAAREIFVSTSQKLLINV